MMTSTNDRAALRATEEGVRLQQARRGAGWRRWGPYVSERQWGTVREDYSADGDAWVYFPHDHARSRAFRWGEDGLAGFCDARQFWCLGLALWNENDPFLKERLFGLTNEEGNHGEDVKEHYCFIDATPTHAYNRMLYRYPHAAFPYERLKEENRRRGVDAREFEIYDTGVFDGRPARIAADVGPQHLALDRPQMPGAPETLRRRAGICVAPRHGGFAAGGGLRCRHDVLRKRDEFTAVIWHPGTAPLQGRH
jgi:hypothetical protein